MAIRYLMAITAIGLVLVTAALVPPRSYLHPLTVQKGRIPPVSQARQHLGVVERDLIVARLRDSLLHELESDAPITVRVDLQIPAHAATAIRSSLVERWASVMRENSPPLIIALLVSENRALRYSTVYLLPETDTDPCIVLDPLSQYQVEGPSERGCHRSWSGSSTLYLDRADSSPRSACRATACVHGWSGPITCWPCGRTGARDRTTSNAGHGTDFLSSAAGPWPFGHVPRVTRRCARH